jgi:tetratricopeptide (TPR) repeat protein
MLSWLYRSVIAALLVLSIIALGLGANWERAVALYNKGDFRDALVIFQDIVHQRPDAAGAWYFIGLCEFKLKRYKRVVLPLSRAVALLEIQAPDSPDIAGAWYTVGISHFLLSEYEQSIDPLKRYIDLCAKSRRDIDPSARTALGRAYFFMNRYDEALPLLAVSSPDRNESATNAYYAGAIYFKREEDDRAISTLRQAVRANEQEGAPIELLCEALMRKGGKTKSTATFVEAAELGEKLKLISDDQKVASILGRAYLGARQFDRAVAPLEKLARANPDNAQAWLYYGIALSRSGQLRKAMEALEITIQLAPDSVPALSELGYVYETDKQYQQALRIYEKAFAATNDPAIKESIERVRARTSQQPQLQ